MAKRSIQNLLTLPVLLTCLAGLILLLTALNPEKPATEPISNRSIYNNAPTGYRAWYLTSKKAGVPIRIWEKSFSKLEQMPAPATMFMVEPYTVAKTSVIFGQKEANRLLEWVGKGNTLVLLDDFRRFGSNSLIYRLALQIERRHGPDKNNRHNTSPTPNAEPIHIANNTEAKQALGNYVRLPLLSHESLDFGDKDSAYPSSTILAQDAQRHPVLIRLPYHKGSLILGTIVDIGDNTYLNGPANDNYQFLANLLSMEQRPIFINEFIHGYAESGDVFAYYQKNTPLGAIFAQCTLAFLVLLWLSFVRWTPKPGNQRQLAEKISGLAEYTDSMAGIYYRAQAASLPLALQLARIERVLRQRHRVSLQQENQDESRLRHLLGEAQATYSNKGKASEWGPDTLLQALQRAQAVVQKQEKLSPQALLKLSRQLAVLENMLQEGRQHHDGTRSQTCQR